MKRGLATAAVLAFCTVTLGADVRVTTTTTIEGAVAAMMGGLVPSMVTHIKGSKARTDIVVGNQKISTIVDADAKQVTVLNATDMTAKVVTAESMLVGATGNMTMPKIDGSLKPTGQSKLLGGTQCQEHLLTMTMSMADMAGSGKMSPEAATMMKDMRILVNGSMWIAKSGPGVAEFAAFQALSAKNSINVMMQAMPGLGSGGLDRFMESFASTGGLPYLTEMKMSIEGGGDMAPMMKQFGDMKLTSRVTDVSTDALPDDLFTVPTGYKVIK
jgi:hypothetical protein